MRFHPSLLVRLLLFCVAAAGLNAQTCNVTISVSAVPNNIGASETSTLQALVTVTAVNGAACGSTSKGVTWQFSPTVAGGVTGTPAGPDTGGLSTITYTAPPLVSASTRVTVTATSTDLSAKAATTTLTLNPPAIDVGSGAPNTSVQLAFINAFFRNNFNNLVSLPPIAAVKRLGTTGYVQEFNDAAKSGAKLALATVSATAPADNGTGGIAQLTADLYGYYTTVGATTAGLPLYDTLTCPATDATTACTYDFFDKNYVLFAYRTALAGGQDFTVRNAFYTEWTARLGIAGLGRPIEPETAVTASTKTTANSQTFVNGIIYSITSGVNNAKTISVLEPIYDTYISYGGPSGSFGLPTAAEITLSSGVHRQTFEGGILEYTPGGGGPTQRLAVASVAITGAQTGVTINLTPGDSLTVTATPYANTGAALTDRPITWSTTNSRVVSIEVSGSTAVLRAVGGGVATVTAVSEGVLSPKLSFLVIAPCCQVGDGAPATVQRAFQDALTRNKISVQVPVPGTASRVGGGYVQVVQSADGGATYWIAQSDKSSTAYLVGGAVLTAYDSLGGPAGTLGYPSTDKTTGGTQRFENGAALAGNPVRLVTGGVLTKWGALNYESGVAGMPTGDAATFSTFGANTGSAQAFGGGSILAASTGPRSGQAYFVTGLILARYNAIGGAGGDFGMPTSDEFVTSGVHQQNFEGGNITWSAGDSVAKEHAAAKVPGVIASPATLTAGGRARWAIVGFPSGSTLRVSVTGQQDFTVTTANGAYSWDMFFPLTTKSGSVTVRAVDTKGTSTANASLTVKGFDSNRLVIAKVQGDNQTGVPGALLPLPLSVALRDSAGDPVAGAAVTFEASSGASVLTGKTVTDAAGVAQTYVRLQSQEGVTLVRVDAPGIASTSVTFGLRASGSTLPNFPKLQQAGSATLGQGSSTIAQKGALITAVASILRFHQNRSELPGPNGSVDPTALNAFLKGYCPADSKGVVNCDGFLSNGATTEQVVNLWRAADFTGGADVEVELPTTAAIADVIADGSPALLSLGLSRNGALVGGHFVVAMGVAADGSILIQDPNPFFGRASLSDYLNGFTIGSDRWQADLRGVARFMLNAPPATRFLLAALSQAPAVVNAVAPEITSVAGACGRAFDALDAVDGNGASPAGGTLLSRVLVCDGAQASYQVRLNASQAYRAVLDDMSVAGSTVDLSGSAAAAYKVTRPKLNLVVGPQDVSFSAASVVGGATFTQGIAPGGIVSIFGGGLAGPGRTTTVDLDGTAMRVLFATPFQINAEVPLATSPGTHALRVQSAYGSFQTTVTVSAVAPGIFLIGEPPVGAITDASFGLISPTNPLVRGQTAIVFATGLGAVRVTGGLSTATATVTAVVNGVELPVQFAGLAPGFVGLYQVNVAIPATSAPGLGITLTLKVGGQLSNSVVLPLQ